MKFRSGFVTNSSSSSFLVFNVKNPELYNFLISLGVKIENSDDGEFNDGMEIVLPTGEKMNLYDDDIADWIATPDEASSISSWIVETILCEVESVYPAKELDEYSDFVIAFLKLLVEKGVIKFDMDDVEHWDRETLENELSCFDEMDASIEDANIELNTGFEGEVIHLQDVTAKNGYMLSISMDEYDTDEDVEEANGLKVLIVGEKDDFDDYDELVRLIEEKGAVLQGEIEDDTDYVICNDISMDDGQLKRARNICIPIISENGFIYRFGDRNPSEENDDIYGELFECTYDGDFYSMFYEYGIGKVVRTKLR